MYQPEGFTELAHAIKRQSRKNIWCYTGYTFETLLHNPCLLYTSVLLLGIVSTGIIGICTATGVFGVTPAENMNASTAFFDWFGACLLYTSYSTFNSADRRSMDTVVPTPTSDWMLIA